MKHKTVLSSEDYYRLQEIANGGYPMDRETLRILWRKLESAVVREPQEIPKELVTMNSRVHVLDHNTESVSVWRLVFPGDAEPDAGRLSVLSPLGIAILGRRVGERIEWPISSGWARFSILRMTYQPEGKLRRAAWA